MGGRLTELQGAGAGVRVNYRGRGLFSPHTGCLGPSVGVTEGLSLNDCMRLAFSWLHQLTLHFPLTE